MSVDVPRCERAPGPAMQRLRSALRAVQDSVVGTVAPVSVADEAASVLEAVAAALSPFSLTGRPAGEGGDSGRVSDTRTLVPTISFEGVDEEKLTARLTPTPFYTGINGAAHGGALTLIFDEALGFLASNGRPRCRTAYLNVDFRQVALIGRPLILRAHIERIEGRKRYLYGALFDGDVLLAEANGMWVELRPGQP